MFRYPVKFLVILIGRCGPTFSQSCEDVTFIFILLEREMDCIFPNTFFLTSKVNQTLISVSKFHLLLNNSNAHLISQQSFALSLSFATLLFLLFKYCWCYAALSESMTSFDHFLVFLDVCCMIHCLNLTTFMHHQSMSSKSFCFTLTLLYFCLSANTMFKVAL